MDTMPETIGVNLGDRFSAYCVVHQDTGGETESGRIRTTLEALRRIGPGGAPAVQGLVGLLADGTYRGTVLEILTSTGPAARSAWPAARALLAGRSLPGLTTAP